MLAVGSTPYNGQVAIVPSSPSFGTSAVSVLVKRTYKITHGAVADRMEIDEPLRLVDEYYDGADPETATVEHEAEMATDKTYTDVVVNGSAFAPGGRPCTEMQVSIAVADHTHTLLISGDRECHHVVGGLPSITAPQPFSVMPMRYERSYGGRDEVSDANVPFWYPRNFMGTGVVLSNVRESVQGLKLPNIESPTERLTADNLIIGDPKYWHRQPLPQGIGWRQKSWFPRCGLIGSCPPYLDVDVITKEESMGWLPANFVALAKQMLLPPQNTLFANGASLGLSFASVQPGARVELSGLTPDGRLSFYLPTDHPHITLDLGHGEEQLAAKLLTVSLSPLLLQLNLIWSATKFIGEFRKWMDVTTLRAEVA
jgi:hypothetical protein